MLPGDSGDLVQARSGREREQYAMGRCGAIQKRTTSRGIQAEGKCQKMFLKFNGFMAVLLFLLPVFNRVMAL